MDPIKTQHQYHTALARVYELMQLDSKENDAGSNELEVLSMLIKGYESKHYPVNTQPAIYWINQLNLQGSTTIKQACTSIYYLLADDDFSGFHRILSDEIWYFHKGVPLSIHVIDEGGIHTAHQLSDNAEGSLAIVVKAGQWFAADILLKQGFTLVSCAVAPGFDFEEFEMAKKEELIALYPHHTALISRLCRK